MNRLLVLSIVAMFAVAGCQKPGQVIVDPGDGNAASFDVTNLGGADAGTSFSSLDSVGLLPSEVNRYDALFLVTQTTYDNGAGTESFALSAVLIADPSDTCRYDGNVIGRGGLDLGGVLNNPIVNGMFMYKVPYRISLPGTVRDTVVGYAYVANVSPEYGPRTTFSWEVKIPASGPTMTFKPSIETPEALTVLAPAGGAVLSRTKGLVLRWKGGDDDIIIVLSTVNPVTRRTSAVMKFRPSSNTGQITVGPKILKLLPPDRNYELTFIVSNRQESRVAVNAVNGRVLVQAAVVYNIYVQLL